MIFFVECPLAVKPVLVSVCGLACALHACVPLRAFTRARVCASVLCARACVWVGACARVGACRVGGGISICFFGLCSSHLL